MIPRTSSEWGRIVVSGLVAGLIWTLLSLVLLLAVGADFIADTPVNQPKGAGRQIFLLASNFAAGIWAMWIYAAARRPDGSAWRVTAIACGVAWWFIVNLQSGKWIALGYARPETAWRPFVATLPSIVIATLVGAWIYERATRRP